MEIMQNFGLTFNKYIRENARALVIKALGLLAALCILALWIGFWYSSPKYGGVHKYDTSQSVEVGAFSLILMFLAMVGGSWLMSTMESKEKRISTLMTPSSQLSKFVTAWIVNVPLLVGVYVAFAFFADFVRYMVYSGIYGDSAYVELFSFSDYGIPSEVIQVFFMVLIFLQALFALGSTIWTTRSFLKTFIALTVIGMVYSWLFSFGYDLGVADRIEVRQFITGEPSMVGLWILDIVVSLGIYVLAYFRFRESEIINRW